MFDQIIKFLAWINHHSLLRAINLYNHPDKIILVEVYDRNLVGTWLRAHEVFIVQNVFWSIIGRIIKVPLHIVHV